MRAGRKGEGTQISAQVRRTEPANNLRALMAAAYSRHARRTARECAGKAQLVFARSKGVEKLRQTGGKEEFTRKRQKMKKM
jgi:hypothetical protein